MWLQIKIFYMSGPDINKKLLKISHTLSFIYLFINVSIFISKRNAVRALKPTMGGSAKWRSGNTTQQGESRGLLVLMHAIESLKYKNIS